MRRMFPLLLAVVMMVPLLLTACSAKPLREVYTAAGDGSRPEDLDKTTVFKTDDDLNVVVTLNSHNRELPVWAVFVAPDGIFYPTDTLEMDETAGVAVLGLDWEMREKTEQWPEGEPWPEGEWQVEIWVDEAREKTVKFTVKAADTADAG